MANQNIVTIIMSSAIVFLIAYCFYWKKKKKEEESNLTQDEKKQSLKLSSMADKESSADVKMQDESKQSLNLSTMADKESSADVKMQEESKQSLSHLTMADKESSADVKMQDESNQPLNHSTVADKKSSADVKMQALNQREHLRQRWKQTLPSPRPRASPLTSRRRPVFDADYEPVFDPIIPQMSCPQWWEKDSEESASTQFQEVLFTRNPDNLGGEPRNLHSIKPPRPLVRNIVPTVINPVLPDPPERPA